MVCDLEHIGPFLLQLVTLWNVFLEVCKNKFKANQTVDPQDTNALLCHQMSAWIWGNPRGCAWRLIKPFVVIVPLFLFKEQWQIEKQQIFLLFSVSLIHSIRIFYFLHLYLHYYKQKINLWFFQCFSSIWQSPYQCVHFKHTYSRRRWETCQNHLALH